jgi:hypothetical protein
MWVDFLAEQSAQAEPVWARLAEGTRWQALVDDWVGAMPLARAETQAKLWDESMQLWNSVLDLYSGQDKETGPAAIAPEALPAATAALPIRAGVASPGSRCSTRPICCWPSVWPKWPRTSPGSNPSAMARCASSPA